MGNDIETLTRRFEGEWLLRADACMQLSPPYRPWAWIPMIEQYGAIEAAQRLVFDPGMGSGLQSLVKRGRVDLSVERAIIDPRWRRLFSKEALAAAALSLAQFSS